MVRQVALRKIRDDQARINKATENTALMDSYVWVLVHYSILCTFCLSSPVITIAFLGRSFNCTSNQNEKYF